MKRHHLDEYARQRLGAIAVEMMVDPSAAMGLWSHARIQAWCDATAPKGRMGPDDGDIVALDAMIREILGGAA